MARTWYAKNGRPWVYARLIEGLEISGDDITFGSASNGGARFNAARLQKTLEEAEAHSAILVAVTAGLEIEFESQQRWREEKSDEYFFLEMYGSAVVEHLITNTGARLCAWAENHGMAVLPHDSPGYPDWDVAQQPRLLEVIAGGGKQSLPTEISVFESGMMRPKKSQLAVFGLTRHIDRVRRITDLVPCESCSFGPCQYRRAPYQGAPAFSKLETVAVVETAAPVVSETAPAAILDLDAKYTVSTKALDRWTKERLTLAASDDGGWEAVFTFEGTTCTNMGRTLEYEYFVKLGRREAGYPILDERCAPAPDDTGHRYQCRYMNNAEHLIVAIEQEKPLLGQPLGDVISHAWPEIAPGCYCEPASRTHKWGLALQVIHYALAEREKSPGVQANGAVAPPNRQIGQSA